MNDEKRYSDKEIISLCHDVQIGTGGMDYADALNKIAEELTLRGEQETPQDAWRRGQETMQDRIQAAEDRPLYVMDIEPYVAPPLPYQEEKETER